MQITQIIEDLKAERDRIDEAISALAQIKDVGSTVNNLVAPWTAKAETKGGQPASAWTPERRAAQSVKIKAAFAARAKAAKRAAKKAAKIADGDGSAKAKKPKASSWTPEMKVAQSERIRAALAAKRNAGGTNGATTSA